VYTSVVSSSSKIDLMVSFVGGLYISIVRLCSRESVSLNSTVLDNNVSLFVAD